MRISTDFYNTNIFIRYPHRIEELKKLHLPEQRQPFVIEKTINLKKIDYENFITDLCVDRWFIQENAKLCCVDKSDVWHCILIRRIGKTDGVLVQSDGCDFAKHAAYFCNIISIEKVDTVYKQRFS